MSIRLQGPSASDDLKITKHHSPPALQHNNVEINPNNNTVVQRYSKPTSKTKTQCKMTTFFTMASPQSTHHISSLSANPSTNSSAAALPPAHPAFGNVPPTPYDTQNSQPEATALIPKCPPHRRQRTIRLSGLLQSCSIQPGPPPSLAPHLHPTSQTDDRKGSQYKTPHNLETTQSGDSQSRPTQIHRNPYKKKPIPPDAPVCVALHQIQLQLSPSQHSSNSAYTDTTISTASPAPRFTHTRSRQIHPPKRWGFSDPGSIQTDETSDRTPYAQDHDSMTSTRLPNHEEPLPLQEGIR